MLNRLLYLEPGQLRRAWPFFVLYLMLFAALTLADGLSWALFVARVGAEQLPQYQALAAVCVMMSIACYFPAANRQGSGRVFVGILAGPVLLFAGVWAGLSCGLLDARFLGLLFLGREVVFALVLLHFGAFLQEYFSRAELSRVMPVVYAGGRVGGIAGGAALEHLSRFVQPMDLLLLLAALLVLGIVGVGLIRRFAAAVDEPDPTQPAPAAGGARPRTSALPARESVDLAAPRSATLGGFASLLWRSPLLFWITVSTMALFFCRAGLMLQCGLCFQREFADDAALAAFLGRYTQIALAVSLLFQLLVVGRLASWIGLRGAQMAYALVVVAAALGGAGGEMTLAAAMAARFVEGELRYGWRNPLAQMTVNLFPRQIRTMARAWSLGFLIPAATVAASLGLDLLVRTGTLGVVSLATAAAAVGYLAASLGLATSIAEPSPGRASPPDKPILSIATANLAPSPRSG